MHIKTLLKALFKPALLALLVASCALPLVSESELAAQSAAEFQKMKNSTPLSTDAKARRYVNCVAQQIVQQLPEPYKSKIWEVQLFDQDQINAFAMPGGKIGVFTGIFKVADNQSQLAAVLGHEIAHVTQHHSLNRVNREMTQRIGVVGAAAAMGGGQATYDLIQMGAQIGLSLPYGRGQESEADLVGLGYMADAGFDPREAVKLWKNMDRENEVAPPEWFSTHPSSETRIKDLIAALPDALQRYNAAKAAGKHPQCQ